MRARVGDEVELEGGDGYAYEMEYENSVWDLRDVGTCKLKSIAPVGFELFFFKSLLPGAPSFIYRCDTPSLTLSHPHRPFPTPLPNLSPSIHSNSSHPSNNITFPHFPSPSSAPVLPCKYH